MKIQLSQIKPSPKPIRSTWDEDKMNELAQSIKEQGLIVPIKVRPANQITEYYANFVSRGHSVEEIADWCASHFTEWEEDDDGNMWYGDEQWEIVYGHRRAEAARRAGLAEIECIVEGVDDTNALIQALIENVQREDMKPEDTARTLKTIKLETGWSNYELEKRGVFDEERARELLIWLDEKNQGIDITLHAGQGDGVRQVLEIKRALGDDIAAKKAVAEKSSKEGLTYQQTRKVAESIAVTQDPRQREALLNTPYSSFIHDPEINRERADKYGAYDPQSISKDKSTGDLWAMTTEVKMILDYLQTSRKMAEEAIKMDEMGKFAPEARSFVARKAAMMIEAWQKVIDKLEGQDG